MADLLFSDVAPGGKLPFSWPRTVGQVPIIYATPSRTTTAIRTSAIGTRRVHDAARDWVIDTTTIDVFVSSDSTAQLQIGS